MSSGNTGSQQLPPLVKKNTWNLPLLGHAPQLKLRPMDLLLEGQRQFGELFSVNLAGQMTAVFSGPKANEAFFRAPDDQFSVKDAYQMMVPVFGKGVIYDTSPELMSEQVGFLFPALKEQRLRTYVNWFNEEMERYFASWGQEGTADIYTTTNELTIFIAGRCLLGKHFRNNLSTEFAALYHDLQLGINMLAFFAPHLPIPSFKKRDRARIKIAEIISSLVRERRQRGIVEEDFVQTLMEAKYSDGRTLTDDEITGLILAGLFGGQHTSAVLSAWGVIEGIRNPHVIAPVLAEQQAVLGDRSELMMDDLRVMPRLERLVMETERLHPPLIILMRKVLRDFTYKNFIVPKGWMGMVSPGLSHMLPDVFANPERFDPERFAPGREEHKQANYTMITFGGGKHRCIGMAFGFLQVRAVVAYILRNFEVSLENPGLKPDYSGNVVGPRQPAMIRYRRKKASQLISVPGQGSGSGIDHNRTAATGAI